MGETRTPGAGSSTSSSSKEEKGDRHRRAGGKGRSDPWPGDRRKGKRAFCRSGKKKKKQRGPGRRWGEGGRFRPRTTRGRRKGPDIGKWSEKVYGSLLKRDPSLSRRSEISHLQGGKRSPPPPFKETPPGPGFPPFTKPEKDRSPGPGNEWTRGPKTTEKKETLLTGTCRGSRPPGEAGLKKKKKTKKKTPKNPQLRLLWGCGTLLPGHDHPTRGEKRHWGAMGISTPRMSSAGSRCTGGEGPSSRDILYYKDYLPAGC